ncbi:MAG: hypothetical protein Q8O83_05355 [bacterium]|nr:hypothetical protein [bacterium]
MDFSKIHPDAVKFNEIACCAFTNLQSDVSDIKEVYSKEIGEKGEKWVNLFLTIFSNTSRLHFIPSKTHTGFYTDIINKEYEHLKMLPDSMLICGHSPEQHMHALDGIAKKLNKGTRH